MRFVLDWWSEPGLERSDNRGGWRRMVPVGMAAALVMTCTPYASAAGLKQKHLEERLADLEALIVRHATKKGPRKDRISELQTTVSTQAEQIAELKAMVSAQAGEIMALRAELTGQIASLRAALTEETAARKQAEAAPLSTARDYTDQLCSPLSEKLAHVSRQGNDLFITGANLHIVNGAGSTTEPNGLGNLIVGYNELRDANALQIGPDNRSGSHNVIVGTMNNFTSCGGLVVGSVNESSSLFCVVSGGQFNRAPGFCSSVSGGAWNTADHYAAVVTGGFMNFSGARCSAVSGGSGNKVLGQYGSITGGMNGTVSQ